MSNPANPKPFLQFTGEGSLLQQTLRRCSSTLFHRHPIIVASSRHQKLLEFELQKTSILAEVVLEPEGRDSCAAALGGALLALQRDANALVLMLAADHHIPDTHAFEAAVAAARPAAEAGHIVSFGIKPASPATGFGYILPAHDLKVGEVAPIAHFAEKPDSQSAANFVAAGYFWNSGNLLFKAASLVAECQKHAPQLLAAVTIAMWNARHEGRYWHLDPAAYRAIPKISIDYAILEKTSEAWVIAVDHDWSDVGTWDAIAEIQPKDDNDNACHGMVHVKAGRNNFVHAEKQLTILSHVDDLLVITTPDAILITRRGHEQSVKELAAMFAEDIILPEINPIPDGTR